MARHGLIGVWKTVILWCVLIALVAGGVIVLRRF
jgi:hypothetical protein